MIEIHFGTYNSICPWNKNSQYKQSPKKEPEKKLDKEMAT